MEMSSQLHGPATLQTGGKVLKCSLQRKLVGLSAGLGSVETGQGAEEDIWTEAG
jgi:hypothetical protein